MDRTSNFPYSQIIALTGSSGSGKSTAASYFAELGAKIVNADEIAKKVVAKGSLELGKLVDALGPEILSSDQTLNRTKLHQMITSDSKIQCRVEEILHPIIRKESVKQFVELINDKHKMIIYDCPLFFEKKLCELGFKKSILVTSPTSILIDRIMKRDQISAKIAQARLALQMGQHEKVKLADIHIENNGSLDDFRVKIQTIYQNLKNT